MRWHLKSPASWLFTQLFIQMQIKENIKAPRYWPLCGEFTGTGEFPAQMASYAENVFIWWHHHASYTLDNTPGKMLLNWCFIVLCCGEVILPIIFRFTSLALGQWYYCLSASVVNLEEVYPSRLLYRHCKWSNHEEYGQVYCMNLAGSYKMFY